MTHEWTQLSGPAVALQVISERSASFLAPDVTPRCERDGYFFCRYAKTGAAQGWAGVPSLGGHPQIDTLPA